MRRGIAFFKDARAFVPSKTKLDGDALASLHHVYRRTVVHRSEKPCELPRRRRRSCGRDANHREPGVHFIAGKSESSHESTGVRRIHRRRLFDSIQREAREPIGIAKRTKIEKLASNYVDACVNVLASKRIPYV